MVDWKQTEGPKLYRKAKTMIPGGTQLLSKRPEMFLPELWPSYYSKAKGCEIWDLEGRRFVDTTIHGIGACLLGFADEDVNAAVKDCVDSGSMSTLNTPAEVELAELLLEIHPWADMVRYARTGGESLAMAVRIARAATSRDVVLLCGYHGWSDWYLAANLAEDQALDGHLLPGLEPAGVPRALNGSARPFHYNRIDELKALVEKHGDSVAAIVMEPMRSELPQNDFLKEVREIATSIGAVLVFDEVTAGWRFCLGGVHKKLGVDPDIAVFAKSVSNGFPMAAVIGREEVMEAAQKSFISSTYWTEAIGPTAAIATIRKMKAVDVAGHAERIGTLVQEGWKKLADKHGLDITIAGFPQLSHFSIKDNDQWQALRTLLTQCMLDRGYLSTNAFYVSFSHTEEILEGYFAALDETFAILRDAIDKGDVLDRLQGPVAHAGFKRLSS